MSRLRLVTIGLAGITAAAFTITVPSEAASPAEGSVSVGSPHAEWEGGPFLTSAPMSGDLACSLGASDPVCDTYTLAIDGPDSPFYVEIYVESRNGQDDLDLHVFDGRGVRVAAAESQSFDEDREVSFERLILADPPDGTYTVSVSPYSTFGADIYDGSVDLHLGASDGDGFDSTIDTVAGLLLDGERQIQPCLEAYPTALGVSGVTDDGARIDLDILLLLDGITVTRAQQVVAQSMATYDDIDVNLDIVEYDTSFSAPSAGQVQDLSGGVRGSITIEDLFAATKAHVGGVRPDGVDVVFTLTDKEIGEDTDGDGQVDELGVLGVADCIGGVRFDDRSFGIGEAWADQLGGWPLEQHKTAALVFVHEVGHIMGAHHHYAECATAQRPHENNPRVDPRHPCTMMFPSAGPNNHVMSAVEAVTIRGHSSSWARP
ncbi:MAG: hypothetical protein ACT452_16720 [Microthrixaceae bacterium]